MSRLFASGGQSTGDLASATDLPMDIHGWFPLGLHFFHSLHTYFLHVFHYFAFGSGLRDSTDFIIRSSTWLLNIVIFFFNTFLVPNIFLITRYSFLFWLLLFHSSSLLWLMGVPSFQSHWSPLLMFLNCCFLHDLYFLKAQLFYLWILTFLMHVTSFPLMFVDPWLFISVYEERSGY